MGKGHQSARRHPSVTDEDGRTSIEGRREPVGSGLEADKRSRLRDLFARRFG